MLIKQPPKIKPSEITPPEFVRNRRRLLGAILGAPALPMALPALSALPVRSARAALPAPEFTRNPDFIALDGQQTPKEKTQSHNNFYELGTAKEDPAENAELYQPQPWQVAVEGECAKPAVFHLEDLAKLAPMEERIYRLRCVEAWSMVIPWLGFPLKHLLEKVQPTDNAKFVAFDTFNPETLFPDEANRSLPWPYVEGLRMDEAMHDLSLLTFGMFGEWLPTQNGAPVRIVVPWKYGFKSGKALVKIRLTEERPRNTWNVLQPSEYGFYSNVNPAVSHPRWSQAEERAIGDNWLPVKRATEMFNGHADAVAHLYEGMDLRQNF